jgi:hypothetical protein
MQKPQPLSQHLLGEKVDTGRVAARLGEVRDQTSLTGSSPTPKTIGIVVVAALAASAACVKRPDVTADLPRFIDEV